PFVVDQREELLSDTETAPVHDGPLRDPWVARLELRREPPEQVFGRAGHDLRSVSPAARRAIFSSICLRSCSFRAWRTASWSAVPAAAGSPASPSSVPRTRCT